MFSTFLPRYSSFLPPESGIIFIVFTMRTYANFDKIQNYILLNFDKYDFTNNAHIPVASFRQKAGFLQPFVGMRRLERPTPTSRT